MKIDITEALRLHGLWLRNDPAGERANLNWADLREANLTRADLRGADLTGANLNWANLNWADLNWADLTGADLREANLNWADLREANLTRADLRGANLIRADLTGANLNWANLNWADLTGADLREANLREANLREANLTRADLTDCVLGPRSIVPECGSFDAWKKGKTKGCETIIHLRIPTNAKRVSALTSRKCRADRAKVISITLVDGTLIERCGSYHDHPNEYIAGQVITADQWDDDIRVECTHGIHFFITRKEAEEYES